jgi:hypothetical protein
MNIVYIFIVSIILLLIMMYLDNKNMKKMEHFSGGSRVSFQVQADDIFECYYNGQQVASGNNYQQTYYFNVDNVTPNSKFYFGVTNTGGPGSLRVQFDYGGKTHYGDRTNIIAYGKQPQPNGSIIGNRYMGCWADTAWSRDLPLYAGYMSKDQCMMTAFNQKMPYYGLQYGGQCFMGSNYGRYGYKNCESRCGYNSAEVCGGSLANSVYSTVQQPYTTETEPFTPNSKFDDRAKAMWVDSGDWTHGAKTSWALGRWLFELTIPNLDKLDFCPNSDYVEFNPAGCLNARTTQNCISSVLPNYNALTQRCGKKYNYNDPDLFFMVMNKVFSFVYEIDKNEKNIKPSTSPTHTQVKMTDKAFIDRLKTKALSPPKQGYSSGSLYLNEFLQNNFRMLGLLKIIGDKAKYPMDHNQLIGGQLVLPDSPMYYALVKAALKYSKNNKNQLGQMFMESYNTTYKFARIIIDTPNISKECSCLGLSLQDTQQCVPC